jgi:aminopeptidase N
MSTYLACYIVCDFQYKSSTDKQGVKFRVYARPNVVENTAYAARIGPKILDFYTDFFDIPYPLPKQGTLTFG